MPADPKALQALCPDIDPRTVERHWSRLDEDYLACFEPVAAAEHLNVLSRLSAEHPVEVLLRSDGGRQVSCTVLAFDHPFEFSLITGVLASMGLQIDRGDVFTLRPPAPVPPQAATRSRRRWPMPWYRPEKQAPRRDPLLRAVIVDHFQGRCDSEHDFEPWGIELRRRLAEILGLLDRGEPESVERAKRRVNELVTERLSRLKPTETSAALAPIALEIEPEVKGRTRLKIVAQDTPAFLYSLSTALSLHGLSIERVRISGEGTRVEDEVDVVGSDGKPLDRSTIERVRLSVLLTKQFTYFLHQAPDSFAALTRFEELTERIVRLPSASKWLDMLGEPRAMQDLAKLLGTSDFLWEDFIRQQYETLLPIFAAQPQDRRYGYPAETVPLRLEQALQGAATLAEQRDRLNQFKDQEIFLTDLNHILNPGVDFREFSTRLTHLAESLVACATRLVYQDLVRTYGAPMVDGVIEADYAVFGLGKLGGVALGYASDIELFFVYSHDGRTSGGTHEPVTNAEIFEALVRETSRFIRTKREGIFQVDLRLRPYGTKGPLATSLRLFREYYGPSGPAHPFERLALVRLRWIGGSARLGNEVEELRDRFVYDSPRFDLDVLWDLWNKRHEQKERPGQLNAKYSSGALTDLEGTVLLLQTTHARRVPQLRTPRLSAALEGLRRGGVLAPEDYADLVGAYRFLRRLINALRMLRGNAQDLFLPPLGSDDLTHLARRVGYETRGGRTPGDQLADEFQQRTAAVRAFVRKHFGRPCPGEKEAVDAPQPERAV